MAERVRAARQRVIDALAAHKGGPSEHTVTTMIAAVGDWQKCLDAWIAAGAVAANPDAPTIT